MKRFTNIKFIALFALLLAVPFVAGAYTERASAHNGEDHSAEQAQKTADKAKDNKDSKKKVKATTTKASGTVYKYVAQPGDSYSVMARKAIQTYGITKKVSLGRAQILFAETHMTQAAGSPFLNQGQKVSIKESTVKKWVDQAQKLSAAEKAAWQAYTSGANFNTDHVGQTH